MREMLSCKRTFIIGASSGIGRAIAKEFYREGAAVAIGGRSTETLEDIADDKKGMFPVDCDVTEPATVKRAVETAVDTLGGLDVAVNSAGVIKRADMVNTNEEDLNWVVDVNLKGMMRVAREAIPELKQTGGTFIPVSSQLGEVGVEGASVYCGTKGGINNLTRQLAVEYADDGVRVNALAPGIVKTEMNEDVRSSNEDWETEKTSKVPLDRLATPDEVTGPAVFLASDHASYITGHVLVVDGGYLAQ